MKPALEEQELRIESMTEADRELQRTLRRVKRDLRLFLTEEELEALFREMRP